MEMRDRSMTEPRMMLVGDLSGFRSPMPFDSRFTRRLSHTPSRHISTYPLKSGCSFNWYFGEDAMHSCPFNIDTCKGCDKTSLEDHFEDAADIESVSPNSSAITDDDMQIARSHSPSSQVLSFHSAEANRVHIKEEFLRLYFPAGITDNDTDFFYSKLLARESLQGMSRTMNAAIDTISLIQLGTAHSDERLVHEAQSRYQGAVASLNKDLANNNAMFDDGVLGAIYLLGFCEMYRPLSDNSQSVRTHHRGLRDMLLARGPSGMYSKFAQLLLYNFRHVSAIVGCAERKRVAFAGKAWQRCSALSSPLMTALSEQIIVLPAILEKADEAMRRRRPSSGEMFTVLMQLANLEQETHAWLLSWYVSFERQPYWYQNVDTWPDFYRHCSATCKVYQKGMNFPSFSHASAQISYWIALLQMKQTMYDLNRLFPEPLLPKSEATLIAEADECADKLCESVAYLTQPHHGFCGTLRALGPLYYAAKWYSKHMNLEKMAWCDKISTSLQNDKSIACSYSQLITGWMPADGSGREIDNDFADIDAELFEGDDDASLPP